MTIISDPEQSGVEANFKDYQRWMQEQRAAGYKQRHLVLNAGSDKLFDKASEERFRSKHELLGKVVFLRERDIERNWFEREVSKWVPMFYFKMSSLCIRKPRFSEMRPIRYNV